MNSSKEKTLTERQRYWLDHVQACEVSGQGIAAYAVSQGIEAKAMYTGKKELVKKGVLPRKCSPLFQQARITGMTAAANEWRIQLPNGVTVAFSGDVECGALTVVLRAASTAG